MATVLLVEDEVAIRRILARNLSHQGHSMLEAQDVEEACDALRALATSSRPVDLIVLDINLPDASGWELLRWLRAMHERAAGSIPAHVIVISAVRPVQRRLEEFHPDAVLLKPFPIEALFRLVDRTLATTSVAAR